MLMARGLGWVVRFIVSCRGPACQTNDVRRSDDPDGIGGVTLLGRSGSAWRQAGATKLSMLMSRRLGLVMPLSVSSYLVEGRSAVQIIYAQVSDPSEVK